MAEGDFDHRMLELGQALSRIADELDNADRQRLAKMIEATSMPGRTYETLKGVIREFVMMVARYSNISVELVKMAIRAFLSQEFASITKENKSLPNEIENSDDVSIRLFYKALQKGQRKVRDIRLMVVGMFGVGKTSLVENLVENDDSEENNGETVTNKSKKIESTVGIDVRQCLVKEDCKWVQTYFGHTANDRLREVYVPSVDVTDSRQTADTTLLYSRTESFENSTQDTLSSNVNEDKELSAFKEKLVLNEDPEFKMLIQEIYHTKDLSEAYQLEPMLSLWDFAGQYLYYSTHHFFLNARSIYLLLMDVSQSLDSKVKETADFPLSGFLHREFTCHEAFKFWLSSIHMYSAQQLQGTDIKPCVILVGTHKDLLQGNEDEKEKYKEDYFNKALKCFEGTAVIQHVHRIKFLVNNLATSETFDEIKKEVLKVAKSHAFWEEVRPAKWLPLERSLEVFKEKGKEIISFVDLQEADRWNESSIENVDELKIFLHFQHSLGNILFYDTKLLKNIILSPQWIVDAFRCFVTHVRDKDPKQLHLWTDFETKAMLTPELIDEIIDRDPKNRCFRDYKKEIIEYMEHLDMIAKPTLPPIKVEAFSCSVDSVTNADETDIEIDYVGRTPVTEQGPIFSDISQNTVYKAKANEQHLTSTPVQELNDGVPSEFYIVPSLLKSRPDRELMSNLINPVAAVKKTPVLCLKFNDGFMPPSVFHRLIAVCIKRWHTVKVKDQDLLFNGLAVFRITNIAYLTIWFHSNVIFARIAVYREDKSTPFVEVRKFLVQTLNDILSILPKESRLIGVMPFEEYIQCPSVEKLGMKPNYGLMKVSKFLHEQGVMCDHDLHAVEKKDALGLWYGDFISHQVSSKLSDTVLQRKPTEQELGRVSRCIGDEYFRLGLELNLSPPIIQQIRTDYQWYTPTIVFHILYEWMRIGTDVSVKTLRNAMIMVQSDVGQFDKILSGSLEQELEIDYSRNIDFDQVPTEDDIIKMSGKIGDEYWLLGIELFIPEITMQQLKMDGHNTRYRIRSMLQKWKSMDDVVCNIRVLARAVRLVGGDMDKFYEVFQNK